MAGTPTVHVLGTAQDGGIPHAGCACATCAVARRGPDRLRRVACLAVVSGSGAALLVDATPDLPAQVAYLARATARSTPGIDGLLLTHAHMGHYLGLAWLGREAMNVRDLPLWCTPAMLRFLQANRPWSHLFARGALAPSPLTLGEAVRFEDLDVEPFSVPHRGEDSDTVGIEVRGPSRTLVYVPDADVFTPDVVARIRRADVALVDGTFHSRDELGHRAMSGVPHPLVSDSVELLAGGEGEVWFTHLNHTNPLLHPEPARRPALPPGFGILSEFATFPL